MPTQMDTSMNSLHVVDVYDMAISIGKEFEVIIDQYGSDVLAKLMPQVILVLEHLESLAGKSQKEIDEIGDLKRTIERLQSERTVKESQRDKHERELEEMEDAWQREAKDFRDRISKFEDENRKLRKAVSEMTGIEACKRKEEEEEEREQQYELINGLKDSVQIQREQLRSVQRENRQSSIDMEALQSEVQRLVQLNASYRRKSTVTRLQADHLEADKVELQQQLNDKENQILHMSHLLKDHDSPPPPVATPGDNMEKLEERLSLEGKMVVDLTDPNRPRFTLTELRDVLQERNELKTKLLEVEEELLQYRPLEEGVEEGGGSGDAAKEEDEKHHMCDYDIPVQGPINKEPRNKLCPEESLIRRLFQSFLEKLNLDDIDCQEGGAAVASCQNEAG